ncbi:MAG TPA: adenylate/guanylate cyclase domain-containing protein [Gaiellaceae bacterium]
MTTPTTRYARAGDVSIAYQVLGQGPDLLYVPGFVSHAEWTWELPQYARFLRRLASFSRLILLDKRGTGLSDPAAGVASPEERIEDIRAVLDAVGSERATLVGGFDGGTLALLFAAAHPERVAGLVLHATPPKFTQDATYPHGWAPAAIQLYLSASEEDWAAEEGAPLLAPSLAGDAAYRRWFGRLSRMAASPGMAMALLQMNTQLDARAALSALDLPVRVVHAAGDLLVDAGHSRYLAERVRGATLVELPGADHWPFADNADALVAEVEELVTGSRSLPEPDRVLTTLMFTDVVGSTELAASLGDRRWAEVLEDHRALLRREVERFGGREVDIVGDGSLARFDAPTRAIQCAMAARDAVRALGIDLRAGIHTGECEQLGAALGGIHVHVGARVAAQAGTGEIVVSSTVRDLVDGSTIAFEDRGTVELKGVPGRKQLFLARSVTVP